MRKFALFLLLVWAGSMYATDLRIESLHGEARNFALSSIGKIVFEGNMLKLVDNSGEVLVSQRVADISKITFKDASSFLSVPQADIKIYPNPASDMVMIDGLDQPAKITLFTISGQIIKSEVGTQLQVSDVPHGDYLLLVNNQVVKLIKQ